MFKKVILIFLLPVMASGQLIDSDVMPFGAYSSTKAYESDYFTGELLDSMHMSLGFNQHTTAGFTVTATNNFNQHGIYPYPWVGWGQKYAYTHYVITHPESDSSQYYKTGFRKKGSDTILVDAFGDSCGYWYYAGNDTMLYGHGLLLKNNYSLWSEQYRFSPTLKIGVNPGADTGDIVGVFTAINQDYETADSLRFIDTIYVSDLPQDTIFHDTVLTLTNLLDNSNYFTVCDTIETYSTFFVEFFFKTSGQCTVFVDYFELYDQFGKQLMDGDFDADIADPSTNPDYEDKILGWFVKDTEFPANFRPFGYINNLINQAMVDSQWTNPAYGAAWVNHWYYDYYKELLRLAEPKVLWAYLYPIDDSTEYTGFTGYGLQADLNEFLVKPSAKVREALADMDYNKNTDGWMFTPQYWYCDSETGCGNEPRRRPTRAETRCMTYIGMCYHPEGIIAWKLDTSDDYSGNQGILKADKSLREGMGYAIRDDINPYIKAIDSTYLSLTWDDADYASPTHNPEVSLIQSIRAVSNTSEPNPDLGWFHVGEYHDASNNKYFMLVNRACSQGSSDPTEAPSVTAIVEFNSTLNLDYAFVIDIANDVDSNWNAIPETTYTAIMPDSNLYFTTILKAGEGRLFKVVPTSE